MLIITIFLPLYSRRLVRKGSHVIPIRMTNGGHIKDFSERNSKLWTQTTHRWNTLITRIGGLCYPTHSPCQWQQGQEKNSSIKWHCTSFIAAHGDKIIFLLCISHFIHLMFQPSADAIYLIYLFLHSQFSLVSYFILLYQQGLSS